MPVDLDTLLSPASAGAASVLVGTAGWTVPKQSARHFPLEGSHLERYAAVLGAAEINSSFYRPHRRATYERWAASTPAQFRFSVKLPRAITHDAKLVEPQAVLDRFADEVAGLGDKLGCVLVQLPPKLAFDEAVAAAFFEALRARFAGAGQAPMFACEARNPSWFEEPATQLLTAEGITRVIADPAAGQPGPHVPTSADIYVRLHGSPRVYYSSYVQDYLDELGENIGGHVAAGRTVWCIFDNTLSPTFMDEAIRLQRRARSGEVEPG